MYRDNDNETKPFTTQLREGNTCDINNNTNDRNNISYYGSENDKLRNRNISKRPRYLIDS